MAVLIVRKAAAPAGGEGSFNMTAGDFGAGTFVGYFPAFAIGSIDAQPLPGTTLNLLISGSGGNAIAFSGNQMATLGGKTVRVDSVSYPFDGADWAYDSGDDQTVGLWDTAGPTFVNAGAYFVEIL